MDCNLNGGNTAFFQDPATGSRQLAPSQSYVAGPIPCVTVTVTASAAPSLSQLGGTPFGIGNTRTLTVSLSLPAPYTSTATSHIRNGGPLLGAVTPGAPLVAKLAYGGTLSLSADTVLLATSVSPTTFFFTGFSAYPSHLTADTSVTASYTSMEAQLSHGYPAQFIGTNAAKQMNHNRLTADWSTAERAIMSSVGGAAPKLSTVRTFACETQAEATNNQITASFNATLQTYAGEAYQALGGTFTASVCGG